MERRDYLLREIEKTGMIMSAISRLREPDGRALLIYHDGLGVREALRGRYPVYSGKRDAECKCKTSLPDTGKMNDLIKFVSR